MTHKSIPISPIEIINIEDSELSPLISKVQIKVCYVGDTSNRNRSIITKDAARNIAPSLRGAPIVGYYNEMAEDFEEHNRDIEICDGEIQIKDATRPFGFVDLNAKIWFQKFLDDDTVEREYLVTEGYIWTGQYPEAKRIIEKGNNQSMELDEKTLNAFWTKDDNSKPEFFIINEAIVSKLCVLGENCEPCFEGSQITKFSFDEDFEQKLYSMMNELKEILEEGGTKKVFTTYAIEIGGKLWDCIWEYCNVHYPDPVDEWKSEYAIEGVFEDEGQKFVVLQDRKSLRYYRLDFSFTEEDGFIPSDALIEVTKSYTPAAEPQFAQEVIQEYQKKMAEEKDKNDKKETDNSDIKLEEEKCEYAELLKEYSALLEEKAALEVSFAALKEENESLKAEIIPLKDFKFSVEKKEKQAMIDQFYMLSDEDKAEVIANIDNYSVDDIEAKLSIICVRNRVSFDIDEKKSDSTPMTYSLTDDDKEDVAVPAWIKSLRETAKSM